MRISLRDRTGTFAAAGCFALTPVSIAASELLLGIALLARFPTLVRGRSAFRLPRVFWFWIVWAVLTVASCLRAGAFRECAGEVRHLVLIAALFFVVPALDGVRSRLAMWRAVFLTSAAGSLALIVGFIVRIIRFQHEIAAGGDPAFYLRNGGFLHHWMIYATVEGMIFGAMLEFRASRPEERRWLDPIIAIHCVAILLSLTRALWLACAIVLALHIVWRRPRLVWALAAAPALALLLAPGPIRSRVTETLDSGYYSTAERLQMWEVGLRMIREHPLIGVGAGRVEKLYPTYLSAGEPLPAYHGHLHNNALQIAAQFGLPVLAAALFCLAVLAIDLLRECRHARDGDAHLLARCGLLALAAFLITGMTDYTYGHSLGLILLAFAALTPLVPRTVLQ